MKGYIDDVLLLLGCACVVIGVAMLNVPAAVIVSGVFLICLAVILGKIEGSQGKANEK